MSPFTSNVLQVDFDAVYLLLDDNKEGLSQFFSSAKNENEAVVCTIDDQIISITQQMFSETFNLPTEEITEFNMLSSSTIEEMKIKFSLSGAPLKSFGKKDMEIEYRLLNDIVIKPLIAKAGSFDAFTVERLEMMIANTVDIKINWSVVLYNTLVAMISHQDKQHQGFAVSICRLFEKCQAQMRPSSTLHSHKVLNKKLIEVYISNKPFIIEAMAIHPKTCIFYSLGCSIILWQVLNPKM